MSYHGASFTTLASRAVLYKGGRKARSAMRRLRKLGYRDEMHIAWVIGGNAMSNFFAKELAREMVRV